MKAMGGFTGDFAGDCVSSADAVLQNIWKILEGNEMITC